MKRNLLLIALIILIGSCARNEKDFDASGAFEATEIIVSAETLGQVLVLDFNEGDQLIASQKVIELDSTQIYLKTKQLNASLNALKYRRPDVNKQISALNEQVKTAEREQSRISQLVKQDAASTKQLDDVNAQLTILKKQKEALLTSLNSSDLSIVNEMEALQMQLQQLLDQLSKCKVYSPVNGTVLVKYVEKGEVAAPGKALFKIADLSMMRLKAYITGSQLGSVKVGQKVRVFIDKNENEKKEYNGVISRISSQAEFTPKTIQTKDERANQVYAIQVDVRNDGYLKIGMYGEVKFE